MSKFTVAEAFSGFCKNLVVSPENISVISTRYHNITKRINMDYRNSYSDTANSLYVGSYGRDTEISTSDIDMLVCLPYNTYEKFNSYGSNGQSALLQEVKKCIEKTYSTTCLKADGQIISVHFWDGIDFEVLPAFINEDGKTYTFANTNNGGSWKVTDPKAEIDAITEMNQNCNHNLKRLCRMARAWRDTCNVEISGVLIDILAYNFISKWEYKDRSFIYYDWMSRDFFDYMSKQPTSQTRWQVMGSGRYITFYGSFQNKAKLAYYASCQAIEDENVSIIANKEWRNIYGNKFPLL